MNKIGIISLLFLMISPLIETAQPSAQSVNGLYNNLPVELRYLSPLNGYILIKNQQIDHLYHFQQQIKKSGLASPLLELVGSLFHAPIKILKSSATMQDKLTNEVIAILVVNLPTQYTFLAREEKDLKKYKLSIRNTIQERIKSKQSNISSELKTVINVAIDLAIQSAQNKTQPYLAHSVILAYMWLSVQEKSELKRYFEALVEEITIAVQKKLIPTGLPDTFISELDTIITEEYTDENFKIVELMIKKLTENESTQEMLHAYLMENFEKINAYFGYLSDSIAPLLSGVVALKFGKRGFTDCGEATTRNILNIGLFDATTKQFDVNFLKTILKANKYKDNPEAVDEDPLIRFYSKYNTIAKTYVPESRREFAMLVSGIKNVHYQIPDVTELIPGMTEKIACEIKGERGIINLIRVIEFILFGQQYEEKTQEQRLNAIFKTLSHPEKELTWKFDSDNGKWGSLVISVNQQPLYVVYIEQKHLTFPSD